MFGAGYWSLGLLFGAIGDGPAQISLVDSLTEALELSWNAAFRGLFILPLSAPDSPTSLSERLFFPGIPFAGLLTRLLVTLQALLSLLLVFLFALAVRRKFQIS